MYQHIEKQVPILKKYSDQLIAEGVITKEAYDEMIKTIVGVYEQGFEEGMKTVPRASEWLESRWEGFKSPAQLARISQTGINVETLQSIGKALYTIPEGFTAHNTIKKNMREKAAMFETGKGFDWATAEALAFGSLMLENNHVRLSGQDVERGTFSHRHAVLHDQKNGSTYTPLTHLSPKQAVFTVSNSSLSEFAVLGFELGYSLENPNSLILWEAQFGDFANGAQVIIDQFISCGEMKWMRQSGLVLLLPHGYDGAGPEHSSARLERFLQLSDSDPTKVPSKDEGDRKQLQHSNWCVVNCTTPANYFHVLRRQVHRDFRKPLIVMTSKWLLRYQPSFSQLSEFTDSSDTPRFRRVIPEATPEAINPPAKVTRLVFCSGQVYYLLLKARTDNNVKDVAIVRLEQLYPFPFDLVTQQAELYPNADIVWCQEEPMNMGAWNFVFPHLLTALNKKTPKYSGRPVSASPAVASVKLHESQLSHFLSDALRVKIQSHP
jgi:2-oxoglutarate dehydrogenase E1 component